MIGAARRQGGDRRHRAGDLVEPLAAAGALRQRLQQRVGVAAEADGGVDEDAGGYGSHQLDDLVHEDGAVQIGRVVSLPCHQQLSGDRMAGREADGDARAQNHRQIPISDKVWKSASVSGSLSRRSRKIAWFHTSR